MYESVIHKWHRANWYIVPTFRNSLLLPSSGKPKKCVTSGFRLEVDENWVLLLYYAASSGNSLSTFRTTYRSHIQGSRIQKVPWPLNMEPIVRPETTVRNYHYSLRNNPGEGRSLSQEVLFGVSLCLNIQGSSKSLLKLLKIKSCSEILVFICECFFGCSEHRGSKLFRTYRLTAEDYTVNQHHCETRSIANPSTCTK
jgi:hypothetical protein